LKNAAVLFVLTILICALFSSAGEAQPARYGFDPSTLDRKNFYQVLEPLAKREGRLVLYNFAGNFDPIWKKGLIPQFEMRYGIKVEYHNVRLAQANQQLMALHRAGASSPVDVYFAGGPENYELLRAAGVLSPINLSAVLPNLATVPAEYKDIVFGIDTAGKWPLVHRNQTALVYDSAVVPIAILPKSFDELLIWAEKHPRKFALTSPSKGGSGSGFLYAAALHHVTDQTCLQKLREPRVNEEEAARWAKDASCLAPLWNYLSRLLKVTELTNGNADTLNLLNNRQVLIGTSWEDLVATFAANKQLPATVRTALLAKAMVGGGDGLVMPANAKNPAAALLFIDMAFGKEFQTWKLLHHASLSPRADLGNAANAGAEKAAAWLVPSAQRSTWSISPNWAMARGLSRVFEDRVLSKL
jgi:ABC-type uncharacterized transport system YnjBCD substrate-binding protein